MLVENLPKWLFRSKKYFSSKVPEFLHMALQGSYSFELFKFHYFPWLFPWPFQVFQDLRISCQFQKFKTFTCFRAFFDLKKFNRHKLWRSPKCLLFTLLNYSSLSYNVLAFSSAVNNLSTWTLIFHYFQGPTIKFHDFPGLEMKFLNSMTFQVFHDLYEPCLKFTYLTMHCCFFCHFAFRFRENQSQNNDWRVVEWCAMKRNKRKCLPKINLSPFLKYMLRGTSD